MPVQPDDMTTNLGVILTVGYETAFDKAAIVLPCVTDSTVVSLATACEDCVGAFAALVLPDLVATFSSDASIIYLSGEGMIDGLIPFRQGYAFGDQAGTRAAGVLPSQVTALGAFYPWPADLPAHTRMRVGKSFFPFIAADDATNDAISDALIAAIQAVLNDLLNGFPSLLDSPKSWYRVLRSAKNRVAGPAIRTQVVEPRNYVATQRRRLKPRKF
jgi:hypothetical protein